MDDLEHVKFEKVLAPSLRRGDILIMDNLGPHKSGPTLELLAKAGVEVKFLPAYSPDFNPIEKMWSKVKNHLRGAGARTLEELDRAIAQALDQVTAKPTAEMAPRRWHRGDGTAGTAPRGRHRGDGDRRESPFGDPRPGGFLSPG